VSVVANVAINVDSRNAVSKLRQVESQATATQRAFGALQSAIAGIGVASIAAQTLKAAASFNDLQTRLKLLTSEYGEYTQAQQFAAKAAKQFGLSNREAATGVADIYARLRPLGVSLKDIQSTFNGFNTIARLSGVSAAGASSAFLQLGQALGSGRLQGDEFGSIAEQIPGLLVAVSKETGIAAKDLKNFASDGKLSADIVINALKRIESEGAGKIAALVQNSDTQKFKDLENAVDDLSVAVGNELLPVVTPLIKDLTSLVGTIAALPDPVKNATGEIIKLIIQLVLVEKAIKAIIALRLGFIGAMVGMTGATVASGAAAKTSAGAFALYTNNTRALQAQAATATPVLTGLKNVLSTIAAIGVITVAVNIAVSGFQSLLAANAELAKLRGRKSEGGAAAMFAGSTKEEVARQQEIARKTKKHEEKTLAGLQSPGSRIAQFVNLGGVLEGLGVPSIGSASRRGMQARARIGSAEAVLGLDPNKFPSAAAVVDPALQALPDKLAAGGGIDKAAREAEKLAQEIQRSLELGDRLGTEFSRQVLLLGEASEIEQKRLQIQFDYEDRAKQIAELKNTEQQTNLSQLNDEIRRLEIIDLQTEELKKQLEEYYKLAGLKAGDMLPGGAGAFRTDINLMPGAGEQQMAKYREELEALTNPINMAVTGANTIGDAFGTAFQDIATGAKSTQEALADAFKSIGSAFISMATEIIAKQMAMIVFQTILKALGGGGGGLFSGAGPVAMPGEGVGGGSSMFGAGAPSFFAEGGFVTGPTNALIGEGGESEYVIPASKMRTAMSRYAGGARGNSVIPGSGAEGGTEQGGVATMEPIDVRYSVERINSVDYVTADQFQRGMQQAAAQGAKQGEQRALSTLKQNTNVRRSVGI
jgi:tape measure domain-containing protein